LRQLYRVRGIAKAFKRAGKGEDFGMGERLRAIDMDTSETPRRAGGWSIEDLGLKLPTAAGLLLLYGGAVLWIDSRLAPIPIIAEQIKEVRAEMYKQGDASRDFALRDDRISELGRRMSILETEGRRR
jgi:hypothetical protein